MICLHLLQCSVGWTWASFARSCLSCFGSDSLVSVQLGCVLCASSVVVNSSRLKMAPVLRVHSFPSDSAQVLSEGMKRYTKRPVVQPDLGEPRHLTDGLLLRWGGRDVPKGEKRNIKSLSVFPESMIWPVDSIVSMNSFCGLFSLWLKAWGFAGAKLATGGPIDCSLNATGTYWDE